MANDEQFTLCWKNFNNNLSAGLYESLCRGDFTDVTLIVEEQSIKVHRLILSVCSPYFFNMFEKMPPHQHAFVFLKDVSYNILKHLIQFMYFGEVNLNPDILHTFIRTAERLRIKGLTYCDSEVGQSSDIITICPEVEPQKQPLQKKKYKMKKEECNVDNSAHNVPVKEAKSQSESMEMQAYNLKQQQTENQQHLIQAQIHPKPVVTGKKCVAQKSIINHTTTIKTGVLLRDNKPTQITVEIIPNNTAYQEPELIDISNELSTKFKPENTELADDIEFAEEAGYDETGVNARKPSNAQDIISFINQEQPSYS